MAGRMTYTAGKLRLAFLPVLLLALAGCAVLDGSAAPRLDANGASLKGIYPVTVKNIDAVRARGLARVNELRAQAGVAPVVMDLALIRAADIHSADMAQQQRAWLFSSDGTSPVERVRRAGYGGKLIGEMVSQTFESEVQTIGEWMQQPQQRAILLDPRARAIGLGVLQEENNKLWWTLSVGG